MRIFTKGTKQERRFERALLELRPARLDEVLLVHFWGGPDFDEVGLLVGLGNDFASNIQKKLETMQTTDELYFPLLDYKTKLEKRAKELMFWHIPIPELPNFKTDQPSER